MKKTRRLILIAAFAALTVSGQGSDAELTKVRESVWRAWFANDATLLEKMVPKDTIVISSGEKKWKYQADVLQTAAKFQADGGKLVRLEFPRTEIQHFGDVAIIYSQYLLETEMGGKRAVESGRVTEVFVRRHGQWINPGWHT